MQKKQIARSAIGLLVVIWLLSGLTTISNAENIPISEEGLEKIGLNKIRLESGIGVIVFNLSKQYDRLEASGYLTMSNTYNSSATISCYVITKLSTVDLDEDGTPRIHKIISDIIIFKPVPDGSWITLEDNKAVIDPYSVYNFRYTVNIDVEYLRKEAKKNNIFNTSEGYLVYINVKKDLGDATGAQIGIDYNYKLFLIFTGELKQESFISSFFLLLIIPASVIIGTSLLFHKKKKSKKVNVVPDINPIRTNENKERKTFKDKSIPDDNAMRQRIDGILRGKDG